MRQVSMYRVSGGLTLKDQIPPGHPVRRYSGIRAGCERGYAAQFAALIGALQMSLGLRRKW